MPMITEYVDRIYKYALSHTFSEDEAEELSQEILLEVLSSVQNLRDESKFEPWLWRLAQNVASGFSRKMGKQRAMFVYDVPESAVEDTAFTETEEELYSRLREKISMLSKIYREIIICYYYDGLSVKQIAERMNIPEGTVTWRLSEARQKLKKECADMNETALKPIKMTLDIYGSGDYNGSSRPFPSAFINDALSQNILWYCYEKPHNIEELSKLCGVPAYYVEERVENLLDRCAVTETVKGKYQTDFIIFTDKYGKYCEENAEAALMPVMERLLPALKRFFDETDRIGHYTAEKSPDELHYLYLALAFDYLSRKYSDIDYPKIPVNYDGNKWRYLAFMESGKYSRISAGHQINANSDMIDGYRHEVFNPHGFGFRNMMYDHHINVCSDILNGRNISDEKIAAEVIKKGFVIRRKSGELFVTVPAFTRAQKDRLDKAVEDHFALLMDDYTTAVKSFIAGYKKLFPKHLEDDAQRQCAGFFFGFYDTLAQHCVESGILVKPQKDWICDVLVQRE